MDSLELSHSHTPILTYPHTDLQGFNGVSGRSRFFSLLKPEPTEGRRAARKAAAKRKT